MPKENLPAIQLYVGDWLKDDIAGCSLEAQGLWLRMMFVMHVTERYGYLQLNGKPIPAESIARRCGCTLPQYLTLLQELDDSGVPSRTRDEVIFSRRMVRDAEKRTYDAERQRKYRQNCHNVVTDLSHPSSSSSSSSASTTPLPPQAGEEGAVEKGKRKRLRGTLGEKLAQSRGIL